MAALFEEFGRPQRSEQLRQQAQSLRKNILQSFWRDGLDLPALALDGRKQIIPTLSSNAGHLLWSGVPDEEQARRMAAFLLGPSMYSGWGIRTLAAGQGAFNPMSYHNGSVWPHDNALIVMGLARYGLGEASLPVLQGLFDAASFDEFGRLPELFCGMDRVTGMHPVWYPVSCCPQAWAAGAFFLLLQAVLGIQPNAPSAVLHIGKPVLPGFLRELTLSKLRVGQSEVSLRFERTHEHTLAHLLALSGPPLQVQIELN
jgi:glycogen debranching enzyme